MAKLKQLTLGVPGTPDTINTSEICRDFIITELGIYGLPGTKFIVNKTGNIILNGSGLLSIGGEMYPITSLKLDPTSYALYKTKSSGHCLIIDIKYEEV